MVDRAGHYIDGIQRPTMPFVGQANGKGRFRTLLSVQVKLRNFESSYRGNATGASAWVNYIPSVRYYHYAFDGKRLRRVI